MCQTHTCLTGGCAHSALLRGQRQSEKSKFGLLWGCVPLRMAGGGLGAPSVPSSCDPGTGKCFVLTLFGVLSSIQGPVPWCGLHVIIWRYYLAQFDLQGEAIALPGFLGIFRCVLTFPRAGVVSTVTSVFSWSWGSVDKLTFCSFIEEMFCVNTVGRKKRLQNWKTFWAHNTVKSCVF